MRPTLSLSLLLALAPLALPFQCTAQHAPAPAPALPGPATPPPFAGEALARHVEVLASDAYLGRFPGTPGETRTLAYIAARFAEAGLTAPYDGGYLQEVPLASVRVLPGSRLVLRADGGEATSLAFPDQVILSAGTDTGPRALRDSRLVFVGHGITAPEYGWDDYADLDVAGCTVVVLWGEPGRDTDADFFRGSALTEHGTSAAKHRLAAEHGATGFLTILDPAVAQVPYEVFADHARQPAHRIVGATMPADRLHRGMLRAQVFAGLLSTAGVDLTALSVAAGQAPASRVLPLQADFETLVEARPVTTHNVVGLLPGATRPDECVLYTAHWDHVGTRDEGPGDRIFNGAVDNATGTAALLELARAFAARPERPARSVLFVATTAEEQGLLGSHFHAEHPLFPLGRTVAVINMDALFPFGATKALTVVAPGQSELDAYLEVAAARVGRRLVADPSPEQGAFFRSDHYPFASRGVPALFAVGGPDQAPDSGETADVQRWVEYVTERYHRPGDEYNAARWDMAGIVQDVTIFHDVGLALADGDDFPNWLPHSEFRALRDAQRAAAGS